MRRLFVVAALLALVSCARSQPVSGSGIEGRAFIGPMCPVEVEGSPCPDRPYATDLRIVSRATGDVVRAVRSGEDGRFRVDVAPGEYRIEPVRQTGPPTAGPVDVTVREDAYTDVTINFDSGIR